MKATKMFKRIICFALAFAMVFGYVPVMARAEESAEQTYYANTGELQENAFVRLPMGAVEAEEFLLQQLYYQKEGLTGLLQDNWSIYGPSNQWRGGSGDYWEKGPYYLRGLVSLAWTLDDAELKEMAMQWLDWILESQVSTGYFGPKQHGDGTGSNWDWWPHMVVVQTLRDYYEATEREGNADERVMTVLGNYFKFQLQYIPSHGFDYWASARGADNIEVVLWYYNRVYDENDPEAAEWLIDLALMIYDQSYNWTDIYTDSTARQHVVNTTQGYKNPAVIWQVTGDDKDRNALREALRNIGLDHGRIDNMANADEMARENYPYRGTETCGVVEAMLSYEIALSILGDSWIADELEYLAYNSLPACYTSDFNAHVYYQSQNQVLASQGDHEFTQDYGDSNAFGVPSGYECCFPNMHMGWAKYVSSMWMATVDGGLAALCYGPNTVTATVAGGKTAVFHEVTDYPFKDTIGMIYEGETASFPLVLRVPEWCESPAFTVNGETVSAQVVDGYVTIDRQWTAGDEVEITFPMEVRTSYWYNDSMAVQYGTLTFSLNLEEEWRQAKTTSYATGNYAKGLLPNYETLPGSDWNYALVPGDGFEVTIDENVALQPFTNATAPVTITATAQLVPQWQLKGNVVPEPPYSPIAEDVSLQETVTLVPYGSTRLHMTQLPWVGEVNENLTTLRTMDDASTYVENGVKVVEFDNVMVRPADSYDLKISYTGTGSLDVKINSKYQKTWEFTGEPIVIENVNKLLTGDFAFGYGRYNNIRFLGDADVEITSIEVIPENVFTAPVIEKAYLSEKLDSMTIVTNIDRSAGFWFLEYGTESGVYTMKVENLFSDSYIVTGLSGSDTYYVRAGMLANGEVAYTDEVKVTWSDEVLVPEFSDDFEDADASADKWDVIGEDVVTFEDGRMNVGKSTNIKVAAGETLWTDYAVSAKLSSDETRNNNFGIMFRVTEAASGPDAYNGYYVGIEASSGKGVMAGYANGSWHQLAKAGDFAYAAGQEYELTVLVCGSSFKAYVDGVLIYEYSGMMFANGQVGVRSYNQPFTVDDFQVRALTEEEIELFASEDEGEDENAPSFSDDFEDAEASAAKWSVYGTTDQITFSDGKLNFGWNGDVKAVAGEESWTDYVVEGDIYLVSDDTNYTTAGNQNAGLIFRATGVGAGADSYMGHYVGIGNTKNGGYYIRGYANGSGWSESNRIELGDKLELNKAYRLKVVCVGSTFSVYLDGVLLESFTSDRYANGKAGVRSWYKSFSLDNFLVRPVTEDDIVNPDVKLNLIETAGACKTGLVGLKNTESGYKVVYGTEPGVYTNTVANLTGTHTNEKFAFSLPENDTTYYCKIIAVSGPRVIGESEEFTVYSGETLDCTGTDAYAALVTKLAEAEALDGAYDSASAKRLSWAIEFANAVIADESCNLTEIALADSSLDVAMNSLVEDPNGAAAAEVEALIDAIGDEITVEDKGAIAAAREAYDALTEEQKALVDNYQKLLDAENALAFAAGDKPLEWYAAPTASNTSPYDKVTGLNDGVNDWRKGGAYRWTAYWNNNADKKNTWVQYTFDCEVSVKGAWLSWYDESTDTAAKSGVKAPESFGIEYWTGSGWAAVNNLDDPTYIPRSGGSYDEGEGYYTFDEVTTTMLRVTMYNSTADTGTNQPGILEWRLDGHFVTELTPSTVEQVIAYIDAIGEVTAESGPAIELARDAYETLSEEDKALVTNYDELVLAEMLYAQLVGTPGLESFATVTASYSNSGDDPSDVNDGIIDWTEPGLNRWTAYGDPYYGTEGYETWIQYTLPLEVKLWAVTVGWYDDGGGCQAPTGLTIEYWNGTEWVALELKSESYNKNAMNTYTFDEIKTDMIRLKPSNPNTAQRRAQFAIAEWQLTGEVEVPADVWTVELVEGLIDAIGTVTVDSGEAIAAAREAYENLTPSEKAAVSNYDVLLAAEEAYAIALAAQPVIDLIDAIGEVTVDSKDAIAAARAAYDALTEEAKTAVTNYEVLLAAEVRYNDLIVVGPVEALIDAIGTVTEDSREAIAAARAAYDALTDEYKAKVGNYDVLLAAEAAYTALIVNPVIALIDAIGEVTLESGEAIEAARDAYDDLADEYKPFVTNYQKLLDDEHEYVLLQAEDYVLRAEAAAEAAQKAYEDAQAAYEKAMAEVAEDKSAAEEARKEAEAAKAAAEEAQKKAEEARAAAEAAKKAAEENRDKAAADALKAAEDAAKAAESAQLAAEYAAATAEAQAMAQAAQAAAEKAQKEAEEAREAAEEAQREAEEAQKEAEENRKRAEEAAERAAEAARKAELASAKYLALYEITVLTRDIDTDALNQHQLEVYEALVEEALTGLSAAGNIEAVDAVLAALEAGLAKLTAACPAAQFTDVDVDAWYHEGVDYMVGNGYMNGMSNQLFAPNADTTRAMLVTLLYRLAGEPDVDGLTNPFEDVKADAWYADAVIWAVSQGIVNGKSETVFDPNAAVTRQEMVTMLWRYAGQPETEATLEGYTDAGSVGNFAATAMAWAVENGIITGVTDTELAPNGTATRAQIATVLMRYIEK